MAAILELDEHLNKSFKVRKLAECLQCSAWKRAIIYFAFSGRFAILANI